MQFIQTKCCFRKCEGRGCYGSYVRGRFFSGLILTLTQNKQLFIRTRTICDIQKFLKSIHGNDKLIHPSYYYCNIYNMLDGLLSVICCLFYRGHFIYPDVIVYLAVRASLGLESDKLPVSDFV